MASMMGDNEQKYINMVEIIQGTSQQKEELNHKPKPRQIGRVKPRSRQCGSPRCWDWALGIGLVLVAILVAALVLFMTYPRDSARCPRDGGVEWEEFQEACYYFETDKVGTFEMAGQACSMKGASLVSIHSQQENDFVYRTLIEKKSTIKDAWTGLFYFENTWKWSDFSQVDYVNWGPGEPNGYEGRREDCVEFCVDAQDFRNRWNDAKCTKYHLYYVCKTQKRK